MIHVDLSGDERFSCTRDELLMMGWGLYDNGDIGCWTSLPEEQPELIVGEQLTIKTPNAVFIGEIVIRDSYGLLAELYPVVEYAGRMRYVKLDDYFNAKLVPDIIEP
jgi:hypothetical protein